ncbi:MAG TPA: glycosyltransferase 87 family protein [Gemmataceae bacterium]|nr:glycosyltransferase 87 family protein [Gemmataceae bacterium]
MPLTVAKAPSARRLAAWGVRAAVVAVLLWQCTRLTDPALLRPSDFVEYWSAGRLNLAGRNPYGAEELFALQRDYGCPDDRPVMMYCPPWALPFVMPFGALDYGSGRLAWLLLHFGLVLVCAAAAWQMFGGSPGRRWVAFGLALTFFPTLITLRMGQLAPLLFAGLLGFLYFLRQGRGLLAGLALLPATLKPQLFHLVWLALLLWAVRARRWSVLCGAALGLVVATGLALAPNPNVLGEYADVMTHHPPAECLSPTLGSVLRLFFGRERFWLQFLPPMLGVAWLVPHWLRHRCAWDWQEQLPLLLLVSLLTTSYGAWPFDLVVLLLPVLGTAAALSGAVRRSRALGVLAGYLAVNALALALNLCGVDGFWFLWMAPAALVAYLALGRAPAASPSVKPA